MNVTKTDAWQKLAQHASKVTQTPLIDFVQDETRHTRLCLELADCRFDFSKQRIDTESLDALLELVSTTELLEHRDAMLAGEPINTSEQRAVLHTALRTDKFVKDEALKADVAEVLNRMRTMANAIRSGEWLGHTGKRITDVVHIGIGGSHLGPQVVIDALNEYSTTDINVHFVSNIDANDLHNALKGLNSETTLFIIASKSFTTLETQINANSARSWFLERAGDLAAIAKHFVAVSNNIAAAGEFGLSEDNLLPMWDSVGGRFSLWSAVGLPILIKLGEENHQALLQGAAELDEHFATSAPQSNVAILGGLLAIWNYNFLGAGSLAVLSYDNRLASLPDYLQQLEMESTGKRVDRDGAPVDFHTMPILWGGVGTNGQHAYHQLLHQGTRAYSADFIIVAEDDRDQPEHHNWLIANALAQSQAMAQGFEAPSNESYREVPGNHPSSIMTLKRLSPRSLGALLAFYEHKVFVQAAIWNINAFDQWGVELGKKMANPIYAALKDQNQDSSIDASTLKLINDLKNTQNSLK